MSRSAAPLLCLAVLAALPLAAQHDPIVIEHVTVVPIAGPDQAGRTVVVRNGRIASILPAGAPAPGDALRIDGRGRFLVPGLTDGHVHLERDAEGWLSLFLAHGVTTVFNLRGGERHLELKRRVAEGHIAGPVIYSSGPFANQPGVASAADAERVVSEQKRAGFDFVKIHGNLSADAYAAMIAAGRKHGIPIIGHAPRNLPFDSVIAMRQPMVAHAEELIYTKLSALDTAAIGDLPARTAHAGIWIMPTLTMFHGIATQWGRPVSVDSSLEEPEARAMPLGIREYWVGSNPYTGRPTSREWVERAYRFQLPLVRALHEAGVPLLAGTDTPLPIMVPGHSVHDEIAELERAGVDRRAALASAIVNPGRFIRTFLDPEARFGLIEPGAFADLLLVAEHPMTNPRTLVHPLGVVARGRWYDRSALDRMVSDATRAASGN